MQPTAYNDHEYFIPIREEYSGFVWIITFVLKDYAPPIVLRFVDWVRTQFGLLVSKIRMDKDSAFISLENKRTKNKTKFENSCAKLGIEIEKTTTATAEQNGASERMGGIIKTMGRTMLVSANLPEKLWPEACSAAVYLRNRSPLEGHKWSSPLEVFLGWFAAHYRWFEPRRLTQLGQDLRPNWSNLRA